MTVACPVARTDSIPSVKMSYSYRSHDAGARIGSISRIMTDGRVFRARRRSPAGSLLIDISGSMSLSSADIDHVLAARPAATIAVYRANMDRGTVSILATAGRRVSSDALLQTMRTHDGCNVIDVPALQWLNHQRGPRWWICDGKVTGLNDQSYTSVTESCAILAYRGKVKRFDNVRQFHQFLASMGGT